MKIKASKTLVLTRREVQQIVQHHGLDKVMDTLIARLTEAIHTFNPEKTVIPMRSGFNYLQPNPGLVEWMPLYQTGEEVIIKLVGYHPQNPDKFELPTIMSTISGYDTSTGHLFGLMDGVFLTALRTGAASAVASNYLAHPDSTVLGLLGGGAQALTQLHALSRNFKIQKVLVYDIDADTMLSFKNRCAILDLDVEIIATDLEAVVAGADILCTATSIDPGAGPLFEEVATKTHLHINSIGSDFPGKVELPVELLKRSFVCPDFMDQALVEGECQQLERADIDADLAEVVKNELNYTAVKEQLSVFDSTGWALEDAVVMELFMDYARDLGLGHEMEIEIVTEDAKNPYGFIQTKQPQLVADNKEQ